MPKKASAFLKKLERSIPKLERDIARTIIKAEATDFHAKNFRDSGFTDRTFQPWKKRKDGDTTRKLLIKRGRMRRHATTGSSSGNTVRFVLPLAYEPVHNEGLRAGRGKGFQMPKRQFIGKSEYLRKRVMRKAQLHIKRHLNKL